MNKRQDRLKSIKWNDGESNLDTGYSKLACQCCKLAWDEMKIIFPEYRKIKIRCEIPDLNITFTDSSGLKTEHKIELKSSKSKRMPGSTIRNLDINQTLIYCLRPSIVSEPYILRCSQYHIAMGESGTDLFVDRTPRPYINFDKMTDVDNPVPFTVKDKGPWIGHYVKCALNRVEETTVCRNSWQDDLVKLLKKEIINDYVSNTSEQQFKIDKKLLMLSKKYQRKP